jgi:hypothetical protein
MVMHRNFEDSQQSNVPVRQRDRSAVRRSGHVAFPLDGRTEQTKCEGRNRAEIATNPVWTPSNRTLCEFIKYGRLRYSAYSSSDRWVAALAIATFLFFCWYVLKKEAETPSQTDASRMSRSKIVHHDVRSRRVVVMQSERQRRRYGLRLAYRKPSIHSI